MPRKHPNTERWGGPGASHEDRNEPRPERSGDPRGTKAATNTQFSRVSGGGGERDLHHGHTPKDKRDFEQHHPRDRRLQP